MSVSKVATLVGFAVAALSTTAFASSFTLSQAQHLVASVSHDSAKATAVFSGPDGLHGLVVKPKVITPTTPPTIARGQIAWATPNGKALIMGPVVGTNGKNYTVQAMYKEHIMARPLAAKAVYQDAKKLHSFVVGTKGPILTALIDPNCIFCHLFYEKVMPYVHSGKVRVRFVVAGFLKPSSRPKAETILSAKNPAAELAYDEAHFRVRVEEGGAPIDKHPTPKAIQEVNADTHLLAETGEIATPTLVIPGAHGTYRTIHGLPRDFHHFIDDIIKNA